MRTTLDLPDKIFRQLKSKVALHGVKLKALVTQFIEKSLAKRIIQLPSPRYRSPLPVLRPRSGVIHPAMSNGERSRQYLRDTFDPDCWPRHEDFLSLLE